MGATQVPRRFNAATLGPAGLLWAGGRLPELWPSLVSQGREGQVSGPFGFIHSGSGGVTEGGMLPGGEEAGTPQSDHRPDSGDSDLVQALWDLGPQSAHSQVGPMLFEPRCAVSITKGVLVKTCICGLGRSRTQGPPHQGQVWCPSNTGSLSPQAVPLEDDGISLLCPAAISVLSHSLCQEVTPCRLLKGR